MELWNDSPKLLLYLIQVHFQNSWFLSHLSSSVSLWAFVTPRLILILISQNLGRCQVSGNPLNWLSMGSWFTLSKYPQCLQSRDFYCSKSSKNGEWNPNVATSSGNRQFCWCLMVKSVESGASALGGKQSSGRWRENPGVPQKMWSITPISLWFIGDISNITKQ